MDEGWWLNRRWSGVGATVIGKVKSPKGNVYEVKWDSYTKDLYVGVSHVGKAGSASEAMIKAEAFVYNK